MRTLASFHNIHAGRDVIVCGCGESLNRMVQPHRFITIGVNDIGRLFHPNYLVVVDAREHLKGDRFHYVETSRAQHVFTSRSDLDIPCASIVHFRLGDDSDPDSADPDVLLHSRPRLMTPHVALCLAIYMGARNIGLIGVDLTDNHFFGATGSHEWAPHIATIDAQFERLSGAALPLGCRIFNLSNASRLTAFPKLTLETFAALDTHPLAHATTQRPLRIVSYATTPLVGVPAILARCINALTPHRARCVWAADSYQTGISFEADVNWSRSPARAVAELEMADVIIAHNGKIDDRHRSLVASKAVVTMAHNYMENVDDGFVRQGFPGLVVGQYQATLPEFQEWSVVPNPVPIWEQPYQPAEKNAELTIAYTPSDKHPSYPRAHPLFWHSKGYPTTIQILDRLATRYKVRLEVLRDRFAAHAEVLEMKRRAHIVIDECVTGSYHRNSLEGLAAGCVVVNGVGQLPGVLAALHHCADEYTTNPFVFADLETLPEVLTALIDLGPDLLVALGASNREWVESNWDFGRQWERFWQPAIDEALRVVGNSAAPVGAIEGSETCGLAFGAISQGASQSP